MNLPLISLGKLASKAVQRLNIGNGSTWPGHIALKVNKHFISDLLKDAPTKTIVVAGTNGKTTTASLINTGLAQNNFTVLQNNSGANLVNGIASTLLLSSNKGGKITQDYAIFEVDENALPQVLDEMKPDYLILMNLFRDQLDRYGEVNTIVTKWKKAIETLSPKTHLILNADDPQVAFLGNNKKNVTYFGLSNTKNNQVQANQASDVNACPQCGEKLTYSARSFSHLGDWHCTHCKLRRPKATIDHFATYPLDGDYNKYNVHASVLVLKDIKLTDSQIVQSIKDFKPAFGRQETIAYKEKNVKLFLSKNPTSFNQSFRTIREEGAEILLIVLNDRIPDGQDISWIWDVDLTGVENFKHILVSGDRAYDMSLRLKYEGYDSFQTYRNVDLAVQTGVHMTPRDKTFFILPTYSAMLEVRKILTGKKIL